MGRIGLCSNGFDLVVVVADPLLLLLEFDYHLLMRPPEDGDIGRLEKFEEVYFVALADHLHQRIDLDIE
jgi:hypothetical protein